MAMDNGFGVNFAPTHDNSDDAARRGRLEGIPQAIQILSMHIPRFLGAKALAPDQLLQAQGAQGMDPYAPAALQSLLKTLLPDLPSMDDAGPFSAPSSAPPPPRIIPGAEDPGVGSTGLEAFEPPPLQSDAGFAPPRRPRVETRQTGPYQFSPFGF